MKYKQFIYKNRHGRGKQYWNDGSFYEGNQNYSLNSLLIVESS